MLFIIIANCDIALAEAYDVWLLLVPHVRPVTDTNYFRVATDADTESDADTLMW